MLVTDASFSAGGRVLAGDALLFATGLSRGAFMVCTMLWKVRPLQAATAASVPSLPFALLYLVLSGGALPEVTLAHFLGQAVMQGLVLGIAALYLTAYAVGALGSQLAALFNPLVPLLTALIAVPLLGETPSVSQWVGIVVVATGMAGGRARRNGIRAAARRPPQLPRSAPSAPMKHPSIACSVPADEDLVRHLGLRSAARTGNVRRSFKKARQTAAKGSVEPDR